MDASMLLESPTEIDDRISLADACQLLPKRSGKTPHLYTVRRWTARGVRGTADQQVRLKAFRVGRTWYTRVSWINEFIAACTGDACPFDNATDDRQSRQPSQQLIEARRWLDSQGVRRAK